MTTTVYSYWQKLGARMVSGDEKSPRKYSDEECAAFMVRTSYDTDTPENPQCGGWRVQFGGGLKDGTRQPKYWKPLEIWAATKGNPNDKKTVWGPGLALYGLLDGELIEQKRIEDLWNGAREHMTKKQKDFYAANKRWEGEEPGQYESAVEAAKQRTAKKAAEGAEKVAKWNAAEQARAAPGEPAPAAVATTAPAPVEAPADAPSSEPGPGHNSQAFDEYTRMRAEIVEELGTLEADIKRKPIKTKPEADAFEDRAKKIAAKITAFNDVRVKEKAPHLKRCNDIDERYNPLIKEWTPRRVAVQQIVNVWSDEERARIKKQLEDEARANFAAAAKKQEEERQAAIAQNAEREIMFEQDPVAAYTGSAPEEVEVPPEPPRVEDFVPVVHVEAIKVGTGRKRTAGGKTPAKKAIISNLADAAAHLAKLGDPDLIALVQKRADAAAKIGMDYPGCTLSDATQGAAA